jgi:hypothetical protein
MNSLANQNLFHTIFIGIPCFLLVDCVELSIFPLAEGESPGVIGYRRI